MMSTITVDDAPSMKKTVSCRRVQDADRNAGILQVVFQDNRRKQSKHASVRNSSSIRCTATMHGNIIIRQRQEVELETDVLLETGYAIVDELVRHNTSPSLCLCCLTIHFPHTRQRVWSRRGRFDRSVSLRSLLRMSCCARVSCREVAGEPRFGFAESGAFSPLGPDSERRYNGVGVVLRVARQIATRLACFMILTAFGITRKHPHEYFVQLAKVLLLQTQRVCDSNEMLPMRSKLTKLFESAAMRILVVRGCVRLLCCWEDFHVSPNNGAQ